MFVLAMCVLVFSAGVFAAAAVLLCRPIDKSGVTFKHTK